MAPIAKQIASKLSVNICLDLFCGAGGMSQGFKHAGFSTVMGVDFDQSACMTYKVSYLPSGTSILFVISSSLKSLP